MTISKPTIIVIGATGAQGAAVVEHLSSTSKYHIIAFTRDTTSPRAQALGNLPYVELVASNATHGYDIGSFFEAAKRSDYVYVNTDGFALGEQAEIFWGIRLYETAARAGIKHLVYSGLEANIGKETNYDPKYYVGHFEGKGRVQDWIKAQPKGEMAWTIFHSGPYIEMFYEFLSPATSDNGTKLFTLPLGEGTVPWQHLPDYGKYTDWILSNREESNWLDFGVGISQEGGKEVAESFTKVTGIPAKYVDVPVAAWVEKAFESNRSMFPEGQRTKVGHRSTSDPSTLHLTYGQNFAAWWNVYSACTDSKGLIKKDYDFLNKIVPDRVKSVEQWFSKTGFRGEKKGLLKSNE